MKLNTQWNWRKVTYLPAFAWVPMKRRALLSLAARGTVCSEISAAGQLAENWSRLSVVFWLSWAFRLPSSLQVLLPLFLKERNTLLYMWCINELSIKYLHNAVIFPGYTIYFMRDQIKRTSRGQMSLREGSLSMYRQIYWSKCV